MIDQSAWEIERWKCEGQIEYFLRWLKESLDERACRKCEMGHYRARLKNGKRSIDGDVNCHEGERKGENKTWLLHELLPENGRITHLDRVIETWQCSRNFSSQRRPLKKNRCSTRPRSQSLAIGWMSNARLMPLEVIKCIDTKILRIGSSSCREDTCVLWKLDQ